MYLESYDKIILNLVFRVLNYHMLMILQMYNFIRVEGFYHE